MALPALLLDHAYEEIKLAALGNEDAKTVEIAHIALCCAAPPLFPSEAKREPQFIQCARAIRPPAARIVLTPARVAGFTQ